MEVKYERKFLQHTSTIENKRLAEEVKRIIADVKEAKISSEIHQLKKLKGYKNAYRIRCGDYRVGIVIEKNTVTFVCFMNRKEIYRHFP